MEFLFGILCGVLLGSTVQWNYLDSDIQVGSTNTPLYVGTVRHSWFSPEDNRQLIVNRAYELWGIDFVLMLECENGNRNPKAVWDGGHSYGLCQMNNRWHNIPSEYYNDWKFQLEYCYKKWNTWTKFYWPSRNIHGTKCSTYVRDRFILS